MLNKSDYTDDQLRVIKSMRAALSMTRQRCRNPKCRDYPYYGGRGITFSDRWDNFDNFLEDMGIRPDGLTLERVDVNGNYEPGNCVWATRAQQSSNTRGTRLITWAGESLPVSNWERRFGWRPGVLKARLWKLGYDLETAMTKPVKPGEKVAGRVYKQRKKPDMSSVLRGVAHPRSSLSVEGAKEVRRRWLSGESFSGIARSLGLTTTTVSNACRGAKAYKGVHDDQ